MSSYIVTRSTISHHYFVSFKKVLREVFVVLFIKTVADIVLGQIEGWKNFNDLIWYTFSACFTIVLWIIGIHFLKLHNLHAKKVYFLFALIITVSQFAACYLPVFSLLVVGSKQFTETPLMVLILKFGLLIILFFADWRKYKLYEYIGEEK